MASRRKKAVLVKQLMVFKRKAIVEDDSEIVDMGRDGERS